MKIVLTGATGFVGRALTSALLAQGHHVTALVRSHDSQLPEHVEQFETGDLCHLLNADTKTLSQLAETISGAQVLVHLAARVHVMDENVEQAAVLYQQSNVAVTEQLAHIAAAAGVSRFVFLSSIKVNGESTQLGQLFTESSAALPEDAYGQSKWQAEQVLMKISGQQDMSYVIVRPPLVYGPGVRANFQQLTRLVQKVPVLPFGAVNNQRSMLALDNLVDFVLLALQSPAAANQTYLVADAEAISTASLIKHIARAYQSRVYLLPVPVWLMRFAAGCLGKGAMAGRLFGSLQLDISKAEQELGWKPVCSMPQQLSKMHNDQQRSV